MTTGRTKTKAELEQERAQLLESLGITEEEIEGKTLVEVIEEKRLAVETSETSETSTVEGIGETSSPESPSSPSSPLYREESFLPIGISNWIKAYSGRDIDPKTIYIADKDEFRVTYRFAGSDQNYSILLNPDGSLVTPPPHQHEYHYPVLNGLTARHLPRQCSCGELEPKS